MERNTGILETIKARRSYRGRYLNDPVPAEDLSAIMEAGLAAPSGCNKQTTSLLCVNDPDVLKKVRAVIDPPVGETAPAMICVLTRRIAAYRDRCFAVQDYSAAIENMLLAITALGYRSCWYEGHITDEDRIGDRIAGILGVPDGYELVCVLPVGKAADEPSAPVKKPFGERAWFNAFPERDPEEAARGAGGRKEGHMPEQVFESDRIRFVKVSEELIPEYLLMVNDYENVNRFIGSSRRTYTAEQEAEWVRGKLAEKAVVFSMIEKESGRFIGNIELMDVNETEGELGIAITAGMQDRGFGTEAVAAAVRYGFDTLGLRRVFLRTRLFNARAIRTYEKCGFREFGRTETHLLMEIVCDPAGTRV